MAEFKQVVRVAKTDLKVKNTVLYALTGIKGVGLSLSNALCILSGIDKTKKTGDLSDEEINKLDEMLKDPTANNIPVWMLNRRKDLETGKDMHIITGDLQLKRDNDIKFMRKIRSYKGLRHQVGLPVRGQRTKSNFRKNKGKVTGVKKSKGKKSGK